MKVRGVSAIVLSSWALVAGSATNPGEGVDCVPCDVLFSKLHDNPSGKQSQHVVMQLRGEPKSGTGMMHQWASGTLYHTCSYLQRLFGANTCRVTWENEDPRKPAPTNRSLIFEPARAGNDAPCSCHDVDRVLISVSKLRKHELPVRSMCTWWHPNGITYYHEDEGIACPTVAGRPVRNYDDVMGCMAEAKCDLTDYRLQMIAMRDPRPVAVSSYYHHKKYSRDPIEDNLEQYIAKILPRICMWITIRYMLFTGTLSNQSTVFWYHEAIADPLDWHHRFLHSIGLHLPSSLIKSATDAALREDFAFNFKPKDLHLKELSKEVVTSRSWEDEVGTDMVDAMNRVVRVWLPPVLLAKLDIPIV